MLPRLKYTVRYSWAHPCGVKYMGVYSYHPYLDININEPFFLNSLALGGP